MIKSNSTIRIRILSNLTTRRKRDGLRELKKRERVLREQRRPQREKKNRVKQRQKRSPQLSDFPDSVNQ
jgi:hypothetical protein